MGTVKLLFFAHLKEQVGQGERIVEISTPSSLKSFLVELEKTLPSGRVRKGVKIAVNREIVQDEAMIIRDGDEISFLPPFSGG